MTTRPEVWNPLFMKGPHCDDRNEYIVRRHAINTDTWLWHSDRGNAKPQGGSHGHRPLDASSISIGGMNHGYGSEQHQNGISYYSDFRLGSQSQFEYLTEGKFQDYRHAGVRRRDFCELGSL